MFKKYGHFVKVDTEQERQYAHSIAESLSEEKREDGLSFYRWQWKKDLYNKTDEMKIKTNWNDMPSIIEEIYYNGGLKKMFHEENDNEDLSVSLKKLLNWVMLDQLYLVSKKDAILIGNKITVIYFILPSL